MAPTETQENTFFLPDFCGLQSVFAVVVLVELFAFVLSLSASGINSGLWDTLAFHSLFMQWAGLLSAAVLCATRKPLSHLGNTVAGFISYLLLLITITLISLAAHTITVWGGLPNMLGERSTFVLSNLGIAAIVCAMILRYFYVTHQWRQRTRAEAQARLQALQARIRPHFLFNSINTVTSLIHNKPDEAEEALLDLADLFRASLSEENQLIPLADELALIRRYLNMESLRLGARLQIAWQLDEGVEEHSLPPLILQPLVENAVYHGVEPLPGGGTISIAILRQNGQLKITVSNPLPGEASRKSEGNRIALNNIRSRLSAHYGERASLDLTEEGGEFRVELCLPTEGSTS